MRYDDHLQKEAENYQSFPKHMFEHWTGFNKLRALEDPVPVGALVPQFYGYYKPERSQKKSGGYLSSILLMEHCGKQILPRNLTPQQLCVHCQFHIHSLSNLSGALSPRAECGSLALRFHEANWVHGSLSPRNILVQPGPLENAHHHRSLKSASFRLIDFGRSRMREGLTEEEVNLGLDEDFKDTMRRVMLEQDIKREQRREERTLVSLFGNAFPGLLK